MVVSNSTLLLVANGRISRNWLNQKNLPPTLYDETLAFSSLSLAQQNVELFILLKKLTNNEKKTTTEWHCTKEKNRMSFYLIYVLLFDLSLLLEAGTNCISFKISEVNNQISGLGRNPKSQC